MKNGFLIMVYGSWGSEPYSFEDTLEEAMEKAKAASEKKPHNEYCVEIDPGGNCPLFKAGKQIGGFE